MSDVESVDAGEEGGWRIATLSVNPADGGTSATLTVVSPLGVAATPGVSSSGGGASWTSAPYELTAAGEWLERWTVTGTGKGKKRVLLRVGPDPFTLPTGARVYATTADYAYHLQKTTPAGARRALWRASRLVEEMTFTAVYDVDVNKMPTDADVIRAFRDATCEQAEFASSAGDAQMIGTQQPVNFSLGRLSVTRAAPPSVKGLGGLGPRGDWSPRAWATLQAAGLTGHEVWA